MTQGELTCRDCQRRTAPAAGYLRPEGFVCKECYEKRLEDPDYVARLERELLGLVRTASEPESTAPGLVVPAQLEGPARLALDSLTGLAVADALGAAREGQPYQPAARPLALPAADSPAAWTDDTQMALSVVTHPHPEGVAGAGAAAVAAWHAARSRGGSAPDTERLLEAIAAACPPESEVAVGLRAARELPEDADLGNAVRRLGNGSRVSCPDTVPLAVWIACRHLDDYKGAVETAVAAGGDTDTIAAIAGGIVAARVGTDGIPASWLEATEPLPLDHAARPGP
jgi:ADP-ribosylglycohydrolase